MQTVICDYCGTAAELVDSKVIYGRSYGMAYLCPKCGAYVGCHAGTTRPLGRLADAKLREWKKRAHAAFDPIWQSNTLTRRQAYSWLAGKMGLPVEQTHIGYFNVAQCKEVVRLCSGTEPRREVNEA